MTIEQKQSTQIQIDNLLKVDFSKKIIESYPKQPDIGNIIIVKMTISDFINLTKRLLNQLNKEINSNDRVILPFSYSNAEYGSSTIDQIISTLYSQIIGNQLIHAENTLIWLAQYCLQNGFYDRSKYKIQSVDTLKLEKQKDDLDLLSENYKSLKTHYETLLEKIENSQKSLEDFHSTKIIELQQITNNLSASNSNTNQIQGLLNTSTESNTKINSLVEQVSKEKNKIEELNTDTKKKFNELLDEYKTNLEELTKSEIKFKSSNDTFDEKLKFVQNKTKYFEERNIYLDELIGREVGASLFETFKQRKTELNSPLIFWRAIVLLMGILTFAVVLAIFTNFFGFLGPIPTTYTWELITVNFFKSVPFIFLLYYTISQYNKERNFQEEYAFKSASALTIKAYSDILLNDDNKDQLILKAVYNIYKSPLQQSVKGNKKDINNITDLLSEVVDKATEILKKKE